MVQIFKTKRDINGNTYYLQVDHEKKTVKTDYNVYINTVDYVLTIGKRDLTNYRQYLQNNGFEWIV